MDILNTKFDIRFSVIIKVTDYEIADCEDYDSGYGDLEIRYKHIVKFDYTTFGTTRSAGIYINSNTKDLPQSMIVDHIRRNLIKNMKVAK